MKSDQVTKDVAVLMITQSAYKITQQILYAMQGKDSSVEGLSSIQLHAFFGGEVIFCGC